MKVDSRATGFLFTIQNYYCTGFTHTYIFLAAYPQTYSLESSLGFVVVAPEVAAEKQQQVPVLLPAAAEQAAVALEVQYMAGPQDQKQCREKP